MSATLVIEPFRPEFAEALVALWRASFEHGVGVPNLHSEVDQRRWFDDHLRVETTIDVALHDGKLAGFVAATPEFVSQLYVHVDHLGRGIGTRLLELAKQRSCGSLWLYTFARNANARRFYERHGFEVVALGFEPDIQLEDVKYAWTLAADARAVHNPDMSPAPTPPDKAIPVTSRPARNRVACAAAFVATLLLGLASRQGPSVLSGTFGKYPGDALWGLMVFFGWTLLRPHARSARVAGFTALTCAAVELAKLYQAPWIVDIRHTTAGHLVLGHVFSWQNLVAYAAGVAAGLMIDTAFLARRERDASFTLTTPKRAASRASGDNPSSGTGSPSAP